MNPAYDPQQTEFSDYDKRILGAGDRRGGWRRATSCTPRARTWCRCSRRCRPAKGSDAERAEVLDLVRSRAQAADAARRRRAGAVDLPAADIDAFNQRGRGAERRAGRRRVEGAGAGRRRTRARARSASKTWLRIAELAAAIGALTEADEAAGRARAATPEAQKIAGEIESTRHRIALPLDARQAGRAARARAGLRRRLLGDREADRRCGDAAAARARLGELAAAFPDAPGVDGARPAISSCGPGTRPPAPSSCEAALAKFKGATRAHILLARDRVLAHRKGRSASSTCARAILLDPAEPTRLARAGAVLPQHARQPAADGAGKRAQELLASPLPEVTA